MADQQTDPEEHKQFKSSLREWAESRCSYEEPLRPATMKFSDWAVFRERVVREAQSKRLNRHVQNQQHNAKQPTNSKQPSLW